MEKVVVFYDEYFWTERENFDKLYKLGRIKNKLVLEPEEVLYLLEKNRIKIKVKNTLIESKQEFLSMFRDKINYKIYFTIRYLRDIGYYFDIIGDKIVIHAKGERNNPIYLCIPFFEFEELSWKDILNYLEEAKQMKCKLLLALIDTEFDIVFYEITELRL